RWSPDSAQIAYSNQGRPDSVWVMRFDGLNPYDLSERFAVRPSWSPDGAELAYVAQNGVYTRASDASAPAYFAYLAPFSSHAAAEWRLGPRPPVSPPSAKETYLTKPGVYRDGVWLRDGNGDGVLSQEVE